MGTVDGPEAPRPEGEAECVNGTATMSASGQYGPTQVAAGIVSTDCGILRTLAAGLVQLGSNIAPVTRTLS